MHWRQVIRVSVSFQLKIVLRVDHYCSPHPGAQRNIHFEDL